MVINRYKHLHLVCHIKFHCFGCLHNAHSDRSPSFMSTILKQCLPEKGVATGRMTPYNPQGNSKLNDIMVYFIKALNYLKNPKDC